MSRTLVKVINNIDSYDDKYDFYVWMKTIMVNIHRNDRDRPVTRGTEPVEEGVLEQYAGADWSTDGEILRNSDREFLHELLNRLDPADREILLMRYYDGLSLKEIASFLNKPVSTVGRRIQVAVRLLSGKLKAEMRREKKPLAILGAILLSAGTLFGAYQVGLVDAIKAAVAGAEEVGKMEVAEKVEEAEEMVEERKSGIPSALEQKDEPSASPSTSTSTSTLAQNEEVLSNDNQENTTQQANETRTQEKPTMKLTKTFAAAAAVAGMALGASGEISADSYIRSGLIAQWDGIDNLATGTHVADTNVWVDRMGNSTDLTASYLSFTDGKCAYLQGTKIESACSMLPTTYAESTMEIHAYSPKYTPHAAIDALLATGQGCTLFWQTGAANLGCVYVGNATQCYYAGSIDAPFSFTPPQERDITKAVNTWTMTSGGYKCSVFANGAEGSTKIWDWGWLKPDYTLTQDITFGSAQSDTHYKAYSIRVYDRQLTRDEITFNVAIDRVRFHGATLKAALPEALPDGYRLNETEDGIEVLVKAEVLDGSGCLSINGAEAAESNEIWVPQGSRLSISYAAKSGFDFWTWIGAPEWAEFPEEGRVEVVAHAPLSIGARSNVDPVVFFNSLEVVDGTALTVGYDVAIAGASADKVTLGVCYGQDPNRLGYTNVTADVIGPGVIRIEGLIPSRTYYVKLVADGNGRIGTSETKSVVTEAGSYGAYGEDQPLVTRCDVTGMPGTLRIRGDVTAPEGTVLLVHYGTTTDIGEMTTVSFGTEGIRGGAYFADIKGLAADVKYSVIVEAVNGGFCDRYPVQSATPVSGSKPAVRKVASFDGSRYLQTKEIMTDVFTRSFTMSVWVKNPRGITSGVSDQWGLTRLGLIMGCGCSGGGTPGPAIQINPFDWTASTDAAFTSNPRYCISASVRLENASGKVTKTCTVKAPVELEIWKDDTWHHVAMTYDQSAKTLKFYLDAQLVGADTNEEMLALQDPKWPMTFGSLEYQDGKSNYGKLIGQVAEATVWRGAMDARGIRRLKRGAFTDDDEDLAGHWLTDREPYLEDFANTTMRPYRLQNVNGVPFVDAPDLRIVSPGLALILR